MHKLSPNTAARAPWESPLQAREARLPNQAIGKPVPPEPKTTDPSATSP